MAQTAENVVLNFCRAWERRSLPDVLSLMSDDTVFQMVPRPAMVGHEAVAAFSKPLLESTTAIEFKMLSLAVNNSSVLTERVDVLWFGDRSVTIPIMGIFVVQDGLITEWRDYTDSGHVAAEFVRAGVKIGG